ncbi:CopG family transcriptional regulator [Pseudorhizobium halotolerans]|uniref:CopG family transcriptional regulator n=1 Tax=Pseudorhizobium halotolerans TaxID=1233081 RepID=A0ABM8PSM6_9HYPH|nr:ribbon-helix-helix protein, CopG family [Pseudorhizobium halotolerans]CAD7046219.1 CopG family transcriptional regulator [Pseudorhizobium halotolerans]
MADKPALSDPITLRLPLDILEDVEKIAETADRSRSWVIVRALKYYLMAEGAELLEIATARQEVREGKAVDMDELLDELDALTDTDERARTDAA